MNAKKYSIQEVAVLNALNNATERLTAKQLVAITGINKRHLHEIIAHLQTNGELIVADKDNNQHGYYIARTSSDLHSYFKQATRQIHSLQVKLKGLQDNAHKVDGYKEQLKQQLKQD